MIAAWTLLALIASVTLWKVAVEVAVAIWGPKVSQRADAAAERQRLAQDADYEHWHALFGDPDIATHGRFQP